MPATPIEILATGAQAQSGASAGFDVSTYARCKLDLKANVQRGLTPAAVLDVAIETAPTADGPWRALFTRRYNDNLPSSAASIANSAAPHEDGPFPGSDRFTLGGFDDFLRVRWNEFGDQCLGGPRRDPSLVLGLSGEAI